MRQRRVAAGNGLNTDLSTTIKYVRRTASGAAGNGLGATIKYLRRTRNGAAGNGLAPRSSTCDKQLLHHLPSVLFLLRQRHVAAGNGLGTCLGTSITYVRPKLRPATPPRRRYIAAYFTCLCACEAGS